MNNIRKNIEKDRIAIQMKDHICKYNLVFDISCKCKNINSCSCANEYRVTVTEREFLTDQREERKMTIQLERTISTTVQINNEY